MKKIITTILIIGLTTFCGLSVTAEEQRGVQADYTSNDAVISEENAVEGTENADASTAESDSGGDGELSAAEDPERERLEMLVNEFYEYWQSYTEIEGDNGFEKAVNLAWLYRGDIGGVSAAIAVAVLLAVMALRFMPTVKKYMNYAVAGNARTKNEVMQTLSAELGRYAPALSTVETVAELYPKLEMLFDSAAAENAELRALVAKIGARVDATEKRHAAELALQGATFRDIIALSALPASKKNEILENYRVIQAEYTKKGVKSSLDAAEGETEVSPGDEEAD